MRPGVHGVGPFATRFALVPLTVLLIGALALRWVVLTGPYGWLDADEAVVGLMARHILEGERPLFYWGTERGYLGVLEAYLAALAFALFGPTTTTLKAIPALFSVAWIGASYLLARRLFGFGPALLTAGYLAFPPMMLTVWSVKARLAYAEVLFLGEVILLMTLALPKARRPILLASILGVLAGITYWTNPLSVVYLGPVVAYLTLTMRAGLLRLIGPFLAATVLGAAPVLLTGGPWSSVASAGAVAGATPLAIPENLYALIHVHLPVLVGLAFPIVETAPWEADWATRPASIGAIVLLATLLLLGGLLLHLPSLKALLLQRPGAEAAILVGVTLATLAILPLSNLVGLVAEPRYALPLYAAVPLYASLVWKLRTRAVVLFRSAVALPLILSVYSTTTGNPDFLLAASATASTPENRAVLIDFLSTNDLTRIQTDYWLAYPLAFESGERIIPYAMSGGVNRHAGYVEAVFLAPRPAYVVIRGSLEAKTFYAWLDSEDASFRVAEVSIYQVVYDVDRPGVG